MLVEGKGLVAPAAVKVRLPFRERAFLEHAARERNAFQGFAFGRTKWRRGLIENPTFIGLCGEYALCAFLNKRAGLHLNVDTKLRRFGDSGVDTIANGMTLQVKTRVRGRGYLVRRYDGDRLLPLVSEVYVFATFVQSAPHVLLNGWIWRDTMRQEARFTKSRVAEHWNLDIDDKHLLPMSRLVAEIELRRKAS